MLPPRRFLRAALFKATRWVNRHEVLTTFGIAWGLTFAVTCGCTPADRQTARTVIDTAAPVLCPLLARLNGDAGLVCPDVAKALDAVLTLAKADTRPTFEAAAGVGAAACTPLMLRDVDPTRDPREYVCREKVSEADVRRALGVGHAR